MFYKYFKKTPALKDTFCFYQNNDPKHFVMFVNKVMKTPAKSSDLNVIK